MDRRREWQQNFNLFIFFQLILAFVGVLWLAFNEITAGYIYAIMFLSAIGLVTLSFLFINEEQKETLKKIIMTPFTADYDIAIALYFAGILLPIIIQVILSLFGTGVAVSQVMQPLYANEIVQDIQSFNVAQYETDPFWRWFVFVFTAGTIEEFTFGFALMLVGTLMGMFILKMILTERQLASINSPVYYLIFALLFTMALFAGVHLLNSTYVGVMFVIAALFRFFQNAFIYVLGGFISFLFGYHQSNNNIAYIFSYGWDEFIRSLSSLGGIIILLYFAIIMFFLFRRAPKIINKLGSLFENNIFND